MKKLGYTKEVLSSFSETLNLLDIVLMKEGFGILTRLNMQEKLKSKLDKDIEEYMILGACNPSLAAKAIDEEYEMGLLLPCNIIVYEKQNKVFVSVIMPTVAMNMINNDIVQAVAKQAEVKLIKAIDNLSEL